MSEQAILEKVNDLLKDQHPGGVSLHALAGQIQRRGEYLHIPVQPSSKVRSTFEFYEALANVETELSDNQKLKVILVPDYPDEATG